MDCGFDAYILIVAEVRVHYSWDCIRRLLDAREAGRKVEAGAQHASELCMESWVCGIC